MSLVRVTRHALQMAASHRPPGYFEDVLSSATRVDDLYVYLPRPSYAALAGKYKKHGDIPQRGPGTELKGLLAAIGITATPNCSCNQRAKYMDQMGVEWCQENVSTIVGWLREEARSRGLPFFDGIGTLIVSRAINRARKDAARGRGSPLHAER